VRSSLLAALVALSACSPQTWGPLAVIDEDSQVIAAALGGAGTLQIGQQCVTLTRSDVDRKMTLVWRNSQTSWNATDGRIRFDDVLSGKSLNLADGDEIEVGGAGQSSSPWIARPNTSCPSDYFFVHTVRRLG
jgi:hypothetical protein